MNPVQVLSLFGIESYLVISMFAQFTGPGSVALGIIPWFTRKMELSDDEVESWYCKGNRKNG